VRTHTRNTIPALVVGRAGARVFGSIAEARRHAAATEGATVYVPAHAHEPGAITVDGETWRPEAWA